MDGQADNPEMNDHPIQPPSPVADLSSPDAKCRGHDPGQEDEAKQRLKLYNREREERKRRKQEKMEREERTLRAQLAIEQDRMRQRAEERSAEEKRQKEERLQKFAQDRERRAAERRQLRMNEAKMQAERPKPLFKRMEEREEKIKAEEETRLKAQISEIKSHYEPIDFIQLDKESKQRTRATLEQLPSQRQTAPTLPPSEQRHYYKGEARERAKQEFIAQRHAVEIARQEAQGNKTKAKQYAKLVAELAHVTPVKKGRRAGRSALDLAAEVGGGSKERAASDTSQPSQTSSATPHPAADTEAVPRGRRFGRRSGESLPAVTKELEQRASKINLQLKQGEDQLQRHTEAGAESALVFEERTQLSSTYIDAIKTKVELLEALRDEQGDA